MPVPFPPIATFAACGSLITAVKSSWELSRMLRKKKMDRRLVRDACRVLEDLRYLQGYMKRSEYDHWYDRLLTAVVEKGAIGLRKVRLHLDIIYAEKEMTTRGNTKINRGSTHSKRRYSVSEDSYQSSESRNTRKRPPPPLSLPKEGMARDRDGTPPPTPRYRTLPSPFDEEAGLRRSKEDSSDRGSSGQSRENRFSRSTSRDSDQSSSRHSSRSYHEYSRQKYRPHAYEDKWGWERDIAGGERLGHRSRRNR